MLPLFVSWPLGIVLRIVLKSLSIIIVLINDGLKEL